LRAATDIFIAGICKDDAMIPTSASRENLTMADMDIMFPA